jgi:hypothetical protein
MGIDLAQVSGVVSTINNPLLRTRSFETVEFRSQTRAGLRDHENRRKMDPQLKMV